MTQTPDQATQDRDALAARLEALMAKSDRDFGPEFTTDLRLQIETTLSKLQEVNATHLRNLANRCLTRADQIQLEHLLGMALGAISASTKTCDEWRALQQRVSADFDPKSKDGQDMRRNALDAIERRIKENEAATPKAPATPQTITPATPSAADQKAKQKAEDKANQLKHVLLAKLVAIESDLFSVITYRHAPKHSEAEIDRILKEIRDAGLTKDMAFEFRLSNVAKHRNALAAEDAESRTLRSVLDAHGFPQGKQIEDRDAWQSLSEAMLLALPGALDFAGFKPVTPRGLRERDVVVKAIKREHDRRKLAQPTQLVTTHNGEWSTGKKTVIAIIAIIAALLADHFLS